VEIKLTGKFSLFLLSILAVAGCESTFELPVNEVPKLTIISHLAPESIEGQKVYVYASQTPDDSSKFYTPDHLVVDVTEVETQHTVRLDTTLDDSKVYFEFPEGFLRAGYTYSIYAFAPGFGIVEATTVIPKPSTISHMSIKDVKIEQSDVHTFKKIVRYKIDLEIDHIDLNRYYHLIFYNQYAGLDSFLFILNPESSDDQPFTYHYDYGILIDKEDLAPGQPLTFEFKDWVVNDNDLVRVYAELRTITEAYYKYHSSLARQLIVIQDPFAEPVTIYNNIDGGYGNFSGFAPDVTSSDLPQ
jgi:hypothetical protein